MNLRTMGLARTLLGLMAMAFCVYLLLYNSASAATVVGTISQSLL